MNARHSELSTLIVRPYGEGAILSIEAALERKKMPKLTLFSAGRLDAYAMRKSSGSVPVRTIHHDLRKSLSLVRSIGAQFISEEMYREQEGFAKQAAEKINSNKLKFHSVIAMPQAALEVFRTSAGLRAHKVLHVVNAHPLEHNNVIARSETTNPQEFVPDRVVQRVVREFDLADQIMVPSGVVRDGLIRQGVPCAKIDVVPYGVDLSTFAPGRNEERDVDFLFVGQISYRKGVDLLIESMRELQYRRLELAGPVVSRDLLNDLPNNVRYLGRLGRSATAEKMRRAKVVVLPSREDAYPLAALEALASGSGLVISDAVGTVESVCDQPNVIVHRSGDVASLRQALETAEPAPSERGCSVWDWLEYGDAFVHTAGLVR